MNWLRNLFGGAKEKEDDFVPFLPYGAESMHRREDGVWVIKMRPEPPGLTFPKIDTSALPEPKHPFEPFTYCERS